MDTITPGGRSGFERRCASPGKRCQAVLCCLVAIALASPLPPARAAGALFARLDPVAAHLESPTAVAVDAAGNLYVAEASRGRVVVFDAAGKHRRTLAGLDRPISLAVDAEGRLYVGSAGRRGVSVYDPALTLRSRLGAGDGEFGKPSGIAVDDEGVVYVADSGRNRVGVYGPDGAPRSAFGAGDPGGAGLRFPAAIAFNRATGELVVTDLQDGTSARGDRGGARVQVFSKSGALLRSFGQFGRGDGLLVKPLGVATDAGGRIYVTDAFQNVVQVFDRQGGYLAALHHAGDPLRTPLGIACSAAGRLFVASLNRGRVEVFDLQPAARLVALTVATAGDGSGTVASAPAGIGCPGTCAAAFPEGAAVTLAAAPDPGSYFAGWSGACVGAGACVADLREERAVTAHFTTAAPARGAYGDLNADGLSDVLWIDPDAGAVSAWLLDRALRPHRAPLAAMPRQQAVGIGDADGDGDADVFWREAGTGAVTLWRMEGGAVAGSTPLGALRADRWQPAAAADFDGDGRADLLWRHGDGGALQLWLAGGSGVRERVRLGAYRDARWSVAGAGDFDGDGRADLLWRHADSGALRLWLMDGAAVRERAKPGRAPAAGWSVAGVADFDGDAAAEILWRNGADGRYRLWRMAGATVEAAVALKNPPEKSWRLAGTGDYDGDRRADLLVKRSGAVQACLTAAGPALRCVPLGDAPGLAPVR